MSLKPIPVIRAAYLNQFTKVLHNFDSVQQLCLEQFNLPTNLCDKPNAYIPMQAALAYMCWAARVEDLELDAWLRMTISDFNVELRSTLLRASNLEAALQVFFRLAKVEQSAVAYRIKRTVNDVSIYGSFDFAMPPAAGSCSEWLRIMSLIAVIRKFTGNGWVPTVIALQSSREPRQQVCQAFSQTLFITGQRETGIVFPASLLRLANTTQSLRHATVAKPAKIADARNQMSWDFPTSLRQLIETYLDEDNSDIRLAASIIGCSVRTLQRRLSEYDLSYREILQQARISRATTLLREPSRKIIDVAYAVGYDDPSHFARAFKRMVGITPRTYRTTLQATGPVH